jgi:hypothetical protein
VHILCTSSLPARPALWYTPGLSHRIRAILAFRAAGLLALGLALPGAIDILGAVVKDVEFGQGHPGAVVGILGMVFIALFNIAFQHTWDLAVFVAAIMMLVIGCDRIFWLTSLLERS